MTIYEIINSVANTGSTKAKQQILEDHRDNEVLKQCFLYAGNPRFNFYIRATLSSLSRGADISMDTFNSLDNIINRVITGNDARAYFQDILILLSEEAQDILCRIVNRDLRCGASTSIANKVWKGLIPEYPVLLCSKYDAKAEKYLSQFENNIGFIVQKKEDGGRLLAKVDSEGAVTYHSRNGSTLELYGAFDSKLSPFRNTVFDGELIVKTSSGKPDRQAGNGFYTKAVRNTLTLEESGKFSFQVWDMITDNEYYSSGKEPYTARLNNLITCNFSGNVGVVESEKANTLAECQEFYARMREDGQEGAIIKVATAIWEDSRSKNYVKLKNVSDIDALCTGFEYGSGKYAGLIGNLNCQDSTGMLKFNVGTGLTDEDRKRDPSYFVGSIIECSYNELISAKGRETKSLFLPVYKQIRPDKSVPNALNELK